VIEPIATVIAAWKHTAEAYADPELFAVLTTDRGEDHGVLAPPEVAHE
jgi:hypothetical protein